VSTRSSIKRDEIISRINFSYFISLAADIIDLTALGFEKKVDDSVIYGINCK